MIPDYVVQLQEIQRQFKTFTDVFKETDWKDCVQQRYYDTYVDRSDFYISCIMSGEKCRGKGLNDLLAFIDEKQKEMHSLTGMPEYIPDYVPGGMIDGLVRIDNEYVFGVHGPLAPSEVPVVNREGEREYWDREEHGHKPGELTEAEVEEVLLNRGIKKCCGGQP